MFAQCADLRIHVFANWIGLECMGIKPLNRRRKKDVTLKSSQWKVCFTAFLSFFRFYLLIGMDMLHRGQSCRKEQGPSVGAESVSDAVNRSSNPCRFIPRT